MFVAPCAKPQLYFNPERAGWVGFVVPAQAHLAFQEIAIALLIVQPQCRCVQIDAVNGANCIFGVRQTGGIQNRTCKLERTCIGYQFTLVLISPLLQLSHGVSLRALLRTYPYYTSKSNHTIQPPKSGNGAPAEVCPGGCRLSLV